MRQKHGCSPYGPVFLMMIFETSVVDFTSNKLRTSLVRFVAVYVADANTTRTLMLLQFFSIRHVLRETP